MSITLTTKRFVLNAVTRADEPRIATLCNERELADNAGRIPHPYTIEDARRYVAHLSTAFAKGDEYAFAVREAGEIIACAGVALSGEDWDLGYWVGAPYRGRGVATEAAARVVRFAFEGLGAACVTAGHFIDNPASGGVLRKIGFKATGQTEKIFSLGRGHDVETICFELRPEDLRI